MGAAPAVSLEKMKIEEAEQARTKLLQENTLLEEKVMKLEEQLALASLSSARSPTKMNSQVEEKMKEIVQKTQQAQKAASQAEALVQEAEERVRKRQDFIRNAMKVVTERDKELETTTATMEVLGINPDANVPEDEEQDETARKLSKLKQEQRAKQAAAKHILVTNYEAMVREAEALNAMNAELHARNAQKKEIELTQDEYIAKVSGRKPAPRRASQTPAELLPGPNGPNAVRPKQDDDGCVVS